MTLRPTSFLTLHAPNAVTIGARRIPADEVIPKPMSASLVFSATRDASYVQCTFSGILHPDRFRQPVSLSYGEDTDVTGWFFGAGEADYKVVQGQRTTQVRFRIGPYRLRAQPRIRFLSSRYLYDELLFRWQGEPGMRGIMDQHALVRHGVNPPGVPVATTMLDRTRTTQLGYWLYILANGNLLDVLPSTQPGATGNRDDYLAELGTSFYLKAFAGSLNFDQVVSELYDHFHILVMVDPNYLRQVTAAQLATANFQVPRPEFTVRNVLDLPAAWFSTDQINNLPLADDTNFQAPVPLDIIEDEETLIKFWHDGSAVPTSLNPHGIVNTREGVTLWRHGEGPAWNDWELIGSGEFDTSLFAQHTSPHALFSNFKMGSLNHAHLESELIRDRNEIRLRRRKVKAAAPRDVAELRQFLPGSACRVRSVSSRYTTPPGTHPIYWIAGMKVNHPQMTMDLDLVLPGDDPLRDIDGA